VHRYVLPDVRAGVNLRMAHTQILGAFDLATPTTIVVTDADGAVLFSFDNKEMTSLPRDAPVIERFFFLLLLLLLFVCFGSRFP